MNNHPIKPLSIKEWAEQDRPREKLVQNGSVALSNVELIAILIGSGSRSESAVELSKRILSAVDNNLNELARLDLSELQKFKGIGEAKAISIITALEVGRRRQAADINKRALIQSAQNVFDYVAPYLHDISEEAFMVIFLNNANKILAHKEISSGGMTSTLVDVRVIFRNALSLKATAMILCHNHPSGKLKPSQADIDITNKIIEGANLFDLRVLDHVIVGEKGYFSFADEGMI
jgi:DNA repair protein RadC